MERTQGRDGETGKAFGSRRALSDRATRAMARYAAGEDAAFRELHGLLAPRLRCLCVRLVGRDYADDLMQEVFLKMHRARASFVPDGSVLAWSCAIARTTCIDWQRQSRRRPEALVDPGQLEAGARGAVHSADASSTAHVVAEDLRAALVGLSDGLRAAYVLTSIEGLDCVDAASRLGISRGAVKKRAYRAGEELRRVMRAMAM